MFDAYDGSPFVSESADKDQGAKHVDLSVPRDGLPVRFPTKELDICLSSSSSNNDLKFCPEQIYDWVISLELAEHVPWHYESAYLDNLGKHARRGIVLSWAHRGQVNNDLYYVLRRNERGHNLWANLGCPLLPIGRRRPQSRQHPKRNLRGDNGGAAGIPPAPGAHQVRKKGPHLGNLTGVLTAMGQQ